MINLIDKVCNFIYKKIMGEGVYYDYKKNIIFSKIFDKKDSSLYS